MSTFGDNQVRKIFIANAVHAVRATPDLLAEGEVQAFQADGGGVPTAGDRFYVATKSDGIINRSEIIDPSKVIDSREKTFAAAKPGWSVVIAGTPTTDVGKVVDFVVSIDNYGANNSSSEPYYFHASHTIVSGDTLDTIGAGIASAATLNAAKSGVPIAFAYTAGTDTMAITTTRTPFSLGKFNGEPLKAGLVCKVDDTNLSATVTDAFVDVTDNGIEVANMEWFMLGNTGDIYRGAGYPNNIDSHYVTEQDGNYSAYEFTYYSERMSAPGDKQRAMITIAINDDLDNTAVGVQITAPITAAIG